MDMDMDFSQPLVCINGWSLLSLGVPYVLQFQVVETDNHGRYLGLPSIIGKNKFQIFSFVKDKVWDKVQGWRKKCLSKARKEVLLKTVAQAIPSFVMNVFVLPKCLCEELERMMNSFWWGSGTNNCRGIHWFAWDRLSVPKKKGGMGFRRLFDYNIALVAKQGWRSMKYPCSLMARIFKARYFPDGDFMSAKFGANPSYAWASMLRAQQLIRRKARLRVGSGTNIKVFLDPWIPDSNNPYVTTVPAPGLEDLTVSSLRFGLSEGWDAELIADIFSERDKNLILNIPLPSQPSDDVWYWEGDLHGQYSVKQGYQLQSLGAPVSMPNAEALNWLGVWRLQVPPKVHCFLWRVCSGSLPVNKALAARRVPIDQICPFCNVEAESDFHALVCCPAAIQVWRLTCFGDLSNIAANFIDWWIAIFAKFRTEDVSIMAVILWNIWCNRNSWVWNNKSSSGPIIIGGALNLLAQWRCAQNRISPAADSDINEGDVKWSKPAPGSFKCNSDGAVFESINRLGVGFVIRDADGNFVCAFNKLISASLDPLVAEAISCKEALSWIKQAGLSNVGVELDALILVVALRGDFPDTSFLGLIINKCKTLTNEIGSVSFRFVYRSANQVAHCLARASASTTEHGFWEHVPPQFISDVLAIDLI